MSSALASRIVEEHAAAAARLPAGVVSPDRRRAAIEGLAALGLPTARDENWKYANVRVLERARFVPAPPPERVRLEAGILPEPIGGYARYVFVDGVFAPELSSPLERAGVSVRSLRTEPPESQGAEPSSVPADAADLRLALLNEAFATDAVRVHVAFGTSCPMCLELVFVASADAASGASYPRAEVCVEAGARLGLIERHVGVGNGTSFVNAAVNVDIGRDAVVDHYRVQQAGAADTWFDTLTCRVDASAVYRLYAVSLGAASARSTVHVQLAGERAEVGMYAASVADRRQVHDTYALVDHIAPYARTSQRFRGIAAGRSRVAFNGKVVVRKNAKGADSDQSLRGLLAGPEAEIDVRPQLEIYTDEVRCAHGATAGKLDDNMLFYLLSRGLDRATARHLLEWAFLEDVVARIEVPELRRQIEQTLVGQMNEPTALKELL